MKYCVVIITYIGLVILQSFVYLLSILTCIIKWAWTAQSTKRIRSFILTCDDAQDKDDWRIKGATDLARLTWKIAVKIVYVLKRLKVDIYIPPLT